jgi:hypothetical protein
MSLDDKSSKAGAAPINAIPVYAILIAALFLFAAQFGENEHQQAPDDTKLTAFDFSKRTAAKQISMNQRRLQENDKSPVIQGIERARMLHKITSHDVFIIPQVGTNESKFIADLSGFLDSQGYHVSIVDTFSHSNKRNLYFEGKGNGVLIYVGNIR